MIALHYLVLGCWAVWLGSMVFFSFVVAPTVFGALGKEAAAPLMRAIFPRYYAVGLACGGTALAAALATGAGLRLTVPLVIGLVLVAYARQVITPALNDARDGEDAERFSQLHVLSVRLNMIVMALLLLAGSIAGRF